MTAQSIRFWITELVRLETSSRFRIIVKEKNPRMKAILCGLLLVIFSFPCAWAWADRGKQVVSGYYPSYNSQIQPPSMIPWNHYTHIDYFVAPVENNPEKPIKIENEGVLKETVKLAKAHNVSISLCIGGWTGSKFFSTLVGTSESRGKFATSLVQTIKKYGFDGVDIDWEYPGVPGQEGNVVSPADSKNLLSFLKILRKKFGPNYRISAAVSVKGFMGGDGQYLKDTSSFFKVLDYITIMAYDIYVSGAGSRLAGPNAPLFHTCSDPETKFSVSSAINQWVKSGFGSEKILLGVPAYGYAYTVLSSELEPTKFSGLKQKTSLLFQKVAPTPPQGGKTSKTPGLWIYNDLYVDEKLTKDGRRGKSGYKRHFDSCTRTPFLFNKETKSLIVYDDRMSMFEKTQFAKSKKLGGINVFDTIGDTPDRRLLESIHVLFKPKSNQPNETIGNGRKNNRLFLKQACSKRKHRAESETR